MFKLHIECTKDIDELHINFSDGSSVVTTNPSKHDKGPVVKPEKEPKSSKPARTPGAYKDQILDLDTDFGGVSQEVVKPPQINREDRGVKVADELQNFDF